MEPAQPKKDQKPTSQESPKPVEGEEGEHKSINFLKVDHTLRPDGIHFDAEMGANRK
jgi:hypothetical protein